VPSEEYEAVMARVGLAKEAFSRRVKGFSKGMRQRLLTIPKLRGFKSPHKKPALINIADLDKKFEAGGIITPKILVNKGLIDSPRNGVKIIGEGKTRKAFTIRKCKLSKSAEEKIKKAGGKIE